jgi:chromosome segregation ATPase
MATSPAVRRRQRSTRLTVAAVLLLSAAALVAGALVLGSAALISLAAVVAVLLGVSATRITHSELMQTRRDAAQGQAHQAQSYASLTEKRVAENAEFIDGMTGKLASSASALSQVEEALCSAQRRAAEATRKLRLEEARALAAEDEGQQYARRLDEAEGRAAEAIVRVAELEQERDALRGELDLVGAERDTLRGELDAWHAMGVEGYRKHA